MPEMCVRRGAMPEGLCLAGGGEGQCERPTPSPGARLK